MQQTAYPYRQFPTIPITGYLGSSPPPEPSTVLGPTPWCWRSAPHPISLPSSSGTGADLDGKPRPIYLVHGLANIQWDRDTEWVHQNLVNQAAEVWRGEAVPAEPPGNTISVHRMEKLSGL